MGLRETLQARTERKKAERAESARGKAQVRRARAVERQQRLEKLKRGEDPPAAIGRAQDRRFKKIDNEYARAKAYRAAEAEQQKRQQQFDRSQGLAPSKKTGPKLYEDSGLIVFEKRLRSPVDGKMYAISAETTATVTTAGSLAAVRGRNLAAKAAGAFLVPGGIFLVGNAKVQTIDGRTLHLVVEDPEWDLVLPLHPDAETQARKIAAAVKRAAAKRAASTHQRPS